MLCYVMLLCMSRFGTFSIRGEGWGNCLLRKLIYIYIYIYNCLCCRYFLTMKVSQWISWNDARERLNLSQFTKQKVKVKNGMTEKLWSFQHLTPNNLCFWQSSVQDHHLFRRTLQGEVISGQTTHCLLRRLGCLVECSGTENIIFHTL